MSSLLRTRLQARELRRLFDSLRRLKKDRPTALTELPIPYGPNKRARKERLVKLNETPHPHSSRRRFMEPNDVSSAPAVEQKIRRWESVEEMSAAAAADENEPELRVFEQNDAMPPMLAVARETLTGAEGHILRRLEGALALVDKNPLEMRKDVFYWLGRAQDRPQMLSALTEFAWRTVWALEVEEIPGYRSVLIGELMIAAGAPLSEEQEIGYIGGLFWHDRRAEAIARWRSGIKGGRSPSRGYWNLGVRLLALDCNPEAALYAIQRMEEALGCVRHADWIPIVMAYNHVGDPDKAREMYNFLKKCAAKNRALIKTSQYDQISMSFLDAGQAEMGLMIYKEMIFTGNRTLEAIHADSKNRPRTATAATHWREPEGAAASRAAASRGATPPGGLRGGEQSVLDELRPATASMSLEDLRQLRPWDWDKYFYEGWMQSLLRMGRTDLVYYLVMNEVPKWGQPPDSMYFNWIVRGFLEEGSIEMAEHVANAMIQETLRGLKTTDFKRWAGEEVDSSTATTTTSISDDTPPPEPTEDLAVPAPATSHTFSLLIQFFSRRRHIQKVTAYSTLMSQCNIPPVLHIYNHLLYALHRMQKYERFDRVTSSILMMQDVKPDLVTWQVVWTAVWRRHTVLREPASTHHRQLFAAMASTLQAKVVSADPTIAEAIWQTLIKSFVIVQDFHAVLVALHAGDKMWGMPLDNTILREVTLGVLRARRYTKEETGGLRPVIRKSALEQSVLYLRKAGERLMRRKKGRRGAVAAGKVVMEGNLESLSELLTTELLRRPGYSGDVFVEKVRVAKKEMGVEALEIEW